MKPYPLNSRLLINTLLSASPSNRWQLSLCIYINNFIGIAQRPHLPTTLHHIVRGILSIFRDKACPMDPSLRKHISSETKMAKGDACWSTEKIVLGWLLNTKDGTLSLPTHKADRLRTIITEYLAKRRTSRKRWQQLLGELRHMAMAIRGAKHLFSVLQHVLSDTTSKRLRLSPLVRAALNDWDQLAQELQIRPMPIACLVPHAPSYLGAVDASADGCGGFWLATKFGQLQPTVFRFKFPDNITQQVVMFDNPSGTLSNSDLELAALVLGADILSAIAPTYAASAFLASDNTPAVSWVHKGPRLLQ